MPTVDDVEERRFVTDQVELNTFYNAYILEVYRDESHPNWFYVVFYLPKFKDIYKEKNQGLLIQTEGNGKKLGVQFLYNVGFPGEEVKPQRISNVSGSPAKRFDTEEQDNWLGLPCRIKFEEVPGYKDPSKVYRNISRDWDIKTDGIQPWFEGTRMPIDEVRQLQDKFLKGKQEYDPDAPPPEEDDLPF